MHLFEELQLDGVLEELLHDAGTVVHKDFLVERDWLPLDEIQVNTSTPCDTVMLLKKRRS